MSAHRTPGHPNHAPPAKLSPEGSYTQWRELHALNGLTKPREWHELSEARQRVWRATLRNVFEAGMSAAKAAGTASASLFPNIQCSSCGRAFGPGDQGFSHCEDHQHLTARD